MFFSPYAELALGAFLSVAAWQDLKTREVDVWLFAAMALPAALLAWANWGNPFYYISLAAGILLALFMRALGTGYADSLALAAVSTAPPPPFLPTAFVVVIASAALLPATALWLYYRNRGRPCKMSLVEGLTHVCISGAEYREALARGAAFKYIVGEERHGALQAARAPAGGVDKGQVRSPVRCPPGYWLLGVPPLDSRYQRAGCLLTGPTAAWLAPPVSNLGAARGRSRGKRRLGALRPPAFCR